MVSKVKRDAASRIVSYGTVSRYIKGYINYIMYIFYLFLYLICLPCL